MKQPTPEGVSAADPAEITGLNPAETWEVGRPQWLSTGFVFPPDTHYEPKSPRLIAHERIHGEIVRSPDGSDRKKAVPQLGENVVSHAGCIADDRAWRAKTGRDLWLKRLCREVVSHEILGTFFAGQ